MLDQPRARGELYGRQFCLGLSSIKIRFNVQSNLCGWACHRLHVMVNMTHGYYALAVCVFEENFHDEANAY